MIDKAKEKPKNDYDASQEALMLAIRFREDDLEANRDNILSPNQIDYLAHQKFLSVRQIVIIALLSFLVSVVSVSYLNNREIGIGFIVFSGVFLFAITPTLSHWYKLRTDLKLNQAVGLQGYARLDLDRHNQHIVYIGGLRFKVSREIFLAFKNGDPYVVYYVSRSKTILSAEWLRDESK